MMEESKKKKIEIMQKKGGRFNVLNDNKLLLRTILQKDNISDNRKGEHNFLSRR